MDSQTIDVYYSVQNGGDGSAYPDFMETQKLAEWDQAHMDEGWGESCDGVFRFRVHPGSYLGSPDVMTELGYLIDHYLEEYDYEGWELLDEFMQDFFPNGLPVLVVFPSDDQEYYLICRADTNEQITKRYAYDSKLEPAQTTELGRAVLEATLNALNKGQVQ